MFVMAVIQKEGNFLVLQKCPSKIMPQSWNMIAGKMPSPASINNFAPKYEFPYGKVQYGESLQAALIRDLQEQLGIIVKNSKLLGVHDNIHAFTVLDFTGEIVPNREYVHFAWVTPNELAKCDMVKITDPFVQLLQQSK